MSQSKQVVIVGCGRLGSVLANHLSRAGHRVIVIDQRESTFDKLSVDFSGFKLVGNAVELHTLQDAKIEQADCLFATTTSDNTNLMVAQVAKNVFHIPRVVARVFDPTREQIYQGFGIETISPTRLATSAFLKVIE
jgi:trk system potassium uptake protein TrkA